MPTSGSKWNPSLQLPPKQQYHSSLPPKLIYVLPSKRKCNTVHNRSYCEQKLQCFSTIRLQCSRLGSSPSRFPNFWGQKPDLNTSKIQTLHRLEPIYLQGIQASPA